MIGLDTNVLVRYIMQDDPRQARIATRLLEALQAQDPGFVSQVTIVELVWVLASCYSLSREQIAAALDALLQTRELVVDRADHIAQANRQFKAGKADFADCLIERAGAAAGCESTLSFDVGAVKHAGMKLLA